MHGRANTCVKWFHLIQQSQVSSTKQYINRSLVQTTNIFCTLIHQCYLFLFNFTSASTVLTFLHTRATINSTTNCWRPSRRPAASLWNDRLRLALAEEPFSRRDRPVSQPTDVWASRGSSDGRAEEGWIIPQHSTPDAAIQIFLHYLKRREENSGSFQLLVTLLLTILEPPLPLPFFFFNSILWFLALRQHINSISCSIFTD